jgi:soluble lytic murein transglycosylase
MRRASSAVVVLGLISACSADRQGPASATLKTPIAALTAAPSSAAGAAPNAPSLDLEAFEPLLALPELAAAREATEAGELERAAREIEKARPRLPATVRKASIDFLEARLLDAALDYAGAATAYDAASEPAWALSGYAELGAGRALMQTGKAKDALSRFERVPLDGPIADTARLAVADAASATGDVARAVSVWREYLSRSGNADVVALCLRLGEALMDGTVGKAPKDDAALGASREALALSRRALVHATDIPSIERASTLELRALALLPEPERTEKSTPSVAEEIERAAALVDGKDFEVARQVTEQSIARVGEAQRWSKDGCAAALLRARAFAGLHDLSRAEAEASEIGQRCTEPDTRARALFLAGKYATTDKRYARAAEDYEALETACPTNRLADDARLKRALCYEELGAEGRFTELLTRMPDDYPDGDMVLDGLFELATRRIAKGDWAGAVTVLDRAVSLAAPTDAKRGQEYAGRERYFRARSWAAMGDTEKGLAEYEAIISELPLSYYMLHAYSRLAHAAPDRARKALAGALARSSAASFKFEHRPEFDSAGFTRALELLRIGDAENASREISALGLDHADREPSLLWAIALLYERAGAAKWSNAVAQGLLTDWLVQWPSGDWARAWQIAFPRPFHELVAREAKRGVVAESLVYGVMREESSFDPDAESPAAAYGLMQLIEPTAKHFGAPIGLRPTPASLKRPSVNIAIGCQLLGALTRTFASNPLLAIPAYNAGAGRPERWVAENPTVDFDIWVELIPYQETRRYTKRVVAARAAYAFLYDAQNADTAMLLPLEFAK